MVSKSSIDCWLSQDVYMIEVLQSVPSFRVIFDIVLPYFVNQSQVVLKKCLRKFIVNDE